LVGRCRAKVIQLLGQQEASPVQAPLHGLLRNSDYRSRLSMSQSLDAYQVEHFALVLREPFNRPKHALTVWAQAGRGAGWRGCNPGFRKGRGGGPFI
jgi:hypothetical protein